MILLKDRTLAVIRACPRLDRFDPFIGGYRTISTFNSVMAARL
jgi:hypothetical protein